MTSPSARASSLDASRLGRRLLTIPAFLLATMLVTVALPLLLPLAWLLSMFPATRGALRSAAFVAVYLWCETVGILVSGWLWLRHGAPRAPAFPPDYLTANFRLQCWWASALKRAAEKIFDLRFFVDGRAALVGAPALMLPRHASMADTIIPIVFYAVPQHIRLRYVLKRELLIDPCLDIVGNRLPNYFVDRDSDNGQREIEGVTHLVSTLGPHEGLLIYPEGTRFTTQRRDRAVARLSATASPRDRVRFDAWRDVLPPRLGGTLGLLAANPGRDLVFCAHIGFEGSSHFKTLINGSWTHAKIRLDFWRVRYEDVPHDADAKKAFLFDQWDRMQATVVRLRRMTYEE